MSALTVSELQGMPRCGQGLPKRFTQVQFSVSFSAIIFLMAQA